MFQLVTARKDSSLAPVGVLLGAGAVFWVDLVTRLGVVVWVLYLAPLALSLLVRRPGAPLEVAGLCTALIVAGGFLAPQVQTLSPQMAHLNRAIGVATIWGIALVLRQLIVSRLGLEQRDRLREGQSQLGLRMRGEQSPGELGDRILRYLCEYLNAPVGAFYVRADAGAFRRVATYALSEEDDAREAVAAGEGLSGQAIEEGRLLRFDDVPAEVLPIRSAFGKARPRQLIVVPSAADGEVNGVLELGFFGPIAEPEVELLERSAEHVGVAVRSLQYRTRQKELLERTQRQAEELEVQQEELRVANGELQSQSRALRASQERMEAQQAELEETNARLEEQTRMLEEQRDELVRVQAELIERAGELARANQYKSEFLANMSHELRTPLNSALILARLLADNRDGNLSPEQVRYAASIHAAGTDLLALINDILDLSRIEAGRMDMQPERIELRRVVEMMERMFQPVAEERRLAFATAIEPETPRFITTDPLRLRQILRNLLANAFKFTEKGQVSLGVRRVGGERVAFSVSDTGPGIPAHQQGVIFEAFRQADGSTQRKHGGTGLGLTISRELARRLGGDLRVDSVEGRGSTFTLELPRDFVEASPDSPPRSPPRRALAPPAVSRRSEPELPAAAAAAAAVDDDRDDLSPEDRSLLIVEDDRAFAGILRDLCRELGFRALVACSAADALALAERYRPSAIVLDIYLPDHSGLTVLEQLKRTSSLRHVPVHVISVADHARQAREMGAIDFALKPVERDQLVRSLQNLEHRLDQKIRRVLVVEDVDQQRESIIRLLGAENVEVIPVGTAAEALVQLRQKSFDCMILDLQLPDMSGYELLDRMAADEASSFPPVIVYTGRALSREDETRLRRHARSIVIKGARSPERLLDEVTLFLHQVEAQLSPEQQRILREVRHREAALEDRRILLVEDDVRTVFALTAVFERRGARLEIARNGKEALDALERVAAAGEVVDLILMDIMMPEMDGLTATRRIRERASRDELPIIALTAKAMPDDHRQCLEAGANDYISKPLDVDRLLSLVKVWIPK